MRYNITIPKAASVARSGIFRKQSFAPSVIRRAISIDRKVYTSGNKMVEDFVITNPSQRQQKHAFEEINKLFGRANAIYILTLPSGVLRKEGYSHTLIIDRVII